MSIVRRGAAIALAVMSLAGCHKITYVSDKPMGAETLSGGQDFFILGLVGDEEIDMPQLCPKGMSKLVIYQSFVDGLISALTVGIYLPRSFDLTCSVDSRGER